MTWMKRLSCVFLVTLVPTDGALGTKSDVKGPNARSYDKGLSHTGESAVLDARVVARADERSSAARGPPAALDILT